MKIAAALILLLAVGCDNKRVADSAAVDAASRVSGDRARDATANLNQTGAEQARASDDRAPDATAPATAIEAATAPFDFELSYAAGERLRPAMLGLPGDTSLLVAVDFDDKKYCTGFHYSLNFGPTPLADNFILVESKGIPLAIAKRHSKFLAGTTLDWTTLESGDQGFVFRNPNDKASSEERLK